MRESTKRMITLLPVLLLALALMPFGMQTAQASEYYYFKTPGQSATYKVGDTVPVSFYCGVVISTTSYIGGAPATTTYKTMPVTFKVLKGSKELESKHFTYTRGTTIETSFKPKTAGILKLQIYGLPRSLGATEEVLQETITINVKSKKPSAVKSMKPKIEVVRTGKKTAEITCTNDSGYGMKIYRAKKKKGTYKLIKTTKKNVFTDKKLSAKKVYYYKVRLFAKGSKKTYVSKWSAKKQAPKFKPGVTLSYSAKKGVKISWQKMKGAGYYLVSRNTTGTKDAYDVIACEGSSTTTYYDKDVKKGKTYYYAVGGFKGDDTNVGKYVNNSIKIKIP